MTEYSDKDIVNSWILNATPWINAIQNNEIESRILSTNKAITDTIINRKPETVLDIGCGEGWLTRELNSAGIRTLGIDIVPALIEEAESQGSGTFKLISYEDFSLDAIKETFDLIVCNFSLLGNESVNNIFQCIPEMLNSSGYFVVQTIHPSTKHNLLTNKDGWRKGTWDGFSDDFIHPPPWYFRTLDTWKSLFINNGLEIDEVREPVNPKTREVSSIIFVGQLPPEKTINPDK